MRKRAFFLAILAVMLVSIRAWADNKVEKPPLGEERKTEPAARKSKAVLETDTDKVTYCAGLWVGGKLADMAPLNMKVLVQAIEDVFEKREPALSPEEQDKVWKAYRERREEERKALGEKNEAAGKKFLEENAEKEGVVTTLTGLQYKILREGTGKSPKRADQVRVNYRGTFIDGEEFDSSYQRGEPTKFSVGAVIAGWTEALQVMKEGAKWQLFVPPDLGYGPGTPTIPPQATLLFEIELIEVIEQKPTPTP
ncbi:MAG TPA: FKBP-type peptidyl-prolyl cis-trans isomerase [Sumerlaeia bacterium]|nr:FKBP-type peptidyl-prolyl cis-trans isomerase [Sumerlaeia bacterium]